MTNKIPAWALEVRAIMLMHRITNRQIAKAIGKSEQHVSNILTGYHVSTVTQKAICDYVRSVEISEKAS